MSKAILTAKAARFADASAIAAIESAVSARLGFAGEAETLEARSNRYAALAADYRKAARRAH